MRNREGGEKVGLAVLIFVTILCAAKWMKWKIATLSLAYYIEKNQYRQPSGDDIKECTGFVVRNMIKDLAM